MTDFGQVDAQDYGYGKHQDTQDGIRHHHIATFLGIIEEKLTDAERGEDATQSIKRLGQIAATCRRLLDAQLRVTSGIGSASARTPVRTR